MKGVARGAASKLASAKKRMNDANTRENRDAAAKKVGYGVIGATATLATGGMAIPAFVAYKNRDGIKNLATRAKNGINAGINKARSYDVGVRSPIKIKKTPKSQ